MNVFEAVKQSVTTRQAAEHYGISVNRNGMACCPFHPDRHPSCKMDKRYHCFGCQADGDVIDFVVALYQLSKKDAAVKLAGDFGVCYDPPAPTRGRPKARPQTGRQPPACPSEEQRFQQSLDRCRRILTEYHRLLFQWQREYRPKSPDEPLDPCFIEAEKQLSTVDYLLEDLLRYGSVSEQADFIIENGKEMLNLEHRLQKLAPGKAGGIDAHL